MARSRIIKPGFFTNDILAEVPPLGRLLFAGLWTIADREGRLEDRPKRLKAVLLPYDECDVDALLSHLCANGFITRYECGGDAFIQVRNWDKHQQPHYKEDGSKIPAPEGHIDSQYLAFGVTEAERQAIFDRDGRKCLACGSTDKLTLDHIIPRSKGGTEDEDNLQTLCGRCNSGKNNRIASGTLGQDTPNKEGTSVQPQSNVGSTKVLDDPLVTSYLLPVTSYLLPVTKSGGADKPPSPPTPLRPVPKPKSASTDTSFPDDFMVTPDMHEKIRKKHPDLDIEAATEEWANSMRANTKKYKYTDWRHAWYGAMNRAATWATERGGHTNGQRNGQGNNSYRTGAEKQKDNLFESIRRIETRRSGVDGAEGPGGERLPSPGP